MAKFLKIALAMVAAGSVSTSVYASAEEPVTLYGVKNYSEAGALNGVYSIKAEPGAQPQLEWSDGDIMGNAGVVYTDDGTLYVLTSMDFFGQTFWSYLTCDFKKRSYTYLLAEDLDLDLVKDTAATMTYDPVTDMIYCVCIGDVTSDGVSFALCTMDRKTAKKSPVATLPRQLFTLAVTADGQMYGVADDGWLYKVNKYTAELTPVGDTGMMPKDNQSAVIDYKTNVMYWSALTEEYTGALYSVNLETAEPTLISVYDDPFQIYGLFIEQTAHSASAPAAVSNLTYNFDGASLSGTVSFTLPSVDTEGLTLSGELDYSVKANDLIVATGKGNPGDEINAGVTIPETGVTRFVVTAENRGLAGLASNFEIWVGMDTPKGVTDLTVTVDGEMATATWTLPERGVNGGYVDHSLVRYDIVRGPEDVLAKSGHEGTSFTEKVVRDGVYPVMYQVTPVLGTLKGESIISNVALSGTHFEPPFILDLHDPFLSLVFDIFDVNGDGGTWEWSLEHNYMWCQWPLSEDRQRDDWMITPAIRLEPGFDYTFVLDMRSEGRWVLENEDYEDIFAGELAAYLGRENNPSAMNRPVLEKEVVTNHEWYLRESPAITVDEEGMYYLGLHMTGGQETRNIYNTLLSKIYVEKKKTESGVTDVEADRFMVRPLEGAVAIHNPAGSVVRVMSLDGTVVASTSAVNETLPLSKGIYIVVCDGVSKKIAVR